MTHGSLFSGIGGFDLAAEWMGWENKFHCEWNEFGQKVLHYYWPNAEQFTDITKTDFTKYANKIDILTGGFPCQPYSSAGKRLGKEDERHLWPEMLRAIREISPRWVVGENVRGLTNWNGGLVFNEVQSDLEAEGYEVLPFLLPACAVNAPHRRDRIWFVATNATNSSQIRLQQRKNGGKVGGGQGEVGRERDKSTNELEANGKTTNATNTNGDGFNKRNSFNEVNASEGGINALGDINESNGNGNAANSEGEGAWEQPSKDKGGEDRRFDDNGEKWNATNTRNERLQGKPNQREDRGEEIYGTSDRRGNATGVFRSKWEEFPTKSPICDGNDGLSERLDGITFPKWRNESIKAGGNAIVPQVVLQIFKAIQEYEK